MSRPMAISLTLVLATASPLLAGVYGLQVLPASSEGCRDEAHLTLNACPIDRVVADLRAHFLAGEDFSIAAVRMAVGLGAIWFDDPAEIATFADVVVEICLAESPHDFPKLIAFLGFLPYETLASRLAAAHVAAPAGPGRERLQHALDALPRRR